MKLLFISSLLVAATNAADVDRRRINGITFADQAVEALNLVHKGQAGSNTEQKLVVASKGGDDKSSKDKSSKSSNDKSSKSSRSSNSRDGRGVCGEKDGYCKHYESFLSSVVASKGGDDKSSKDSKSKSSSSKSKSSRSSSGSGDGSRRTDRCFRACDTDRCTSADRRRLECPASTAASSDFVQKGQASPIQKLVWAGNQKGDGGDDDPANPPAPGKKSTSTDDNKNNRDNSKSSSSSKSKSSSSTAGSGDSRSWPGSGDDICVDAPKDWCAGSSADGDDACDDACDAGSDIRCDEKQRKHLGCDKDGVAAVKKLRRRARA